MVTSVSLIGACSQNGGDRFLPTVEVIDGIEGATLAGIPALLAPNDRWRFREARRVHTVSDADSEPLVFDPAGVLPLSDGRLLVYDPTADRPLVILEPSTGNLLGRFGRKGQGPGELGGSLHLAQADDGTVAVLDGSNRRLHRYAKGGERISSDQVDLRGFPRKAIFWPSSGGILLETLHRLNGTFASQLELVDVESGRFKTYARLPDPPPDAEAGKIQQGRIVWTAPTLGVVAMWSSAPVVNVYSLDGTLARKVHLPLTKRNLTERDIQEDIREYGGLAASLRPGPTALTNELWAVNDSTFAMLVTSVWRAREDPAIPAGDRLWRLLTIRGEYLGWLRLPEDFRFLGLGNGTIWFRILDDEGNPVFMEAMLTRRS